MACDKFVIRLCLISPWHYNLLQRMHALCMYALLCTTDRFCNDFRVHVFVYIAATNFNVFELSPNDCRIAYTRRIMYEVLIFRCFDDSVFFYLSKGVLILSDLPAISKLVEL